MNRCSISPYRRRLMLLIGLTAAISVIAASTSFARASGLDPRIAQIPLAFEPNLGQIGSQFAFAARGPGYVLLLEKDALVFINERGDDLRMELASFPKATQIVGLDPLPGRSNYFIGNDPNRWRTDIPQFARVKFVGLYPGIDLVLYGDGRQLEYDFIVSPDGNPRDIQLRFENAKRVSINAAGALVASLAGGSVSHGRPRVRVEHGGITKEIEGRFRKRGRLVSFEIARHDRRDTVIIDPTVTVSTYFGGSGGDTVKDVALDSAGNIYMTGQTGSSDFPVQSAYQSSLRGGTDIFITKLNPSASAVIYSTFLGASTFDIDETSNAIAVDSAGNAYITGHVENCDFPTTPNAFQPDCQPIFGIDAIVTKLNAAGNGLVYSTYLHGDSAGDEEANDIAVDAAGNAYVAGQTDVDDYPVTAGSFQKTFHADSISGDDGFVTVFNPAGSALVYSTFLGGTSVISSIALDARGAAYVTGKTYSTDFPTKNPFQILYGGGNGDAFVTRLNPTGSALEFSTYFGGGSGDSGSAIAVDLAGNAYVTGTTSSTNLPLAHAAQPLFGGGESDAFVAKFSASGAALIFSTFLGGRTEDHGNAIAIDVAGNAYVTGSTLSTNFPTVAAVQPLYGGDSSGGVFLPVGDAFVTKIRSDGSAFVYSTFLGGSKDDVGNAIAVDASSSALIVGNTGSTNFPIVAAIQPFSKVLDIIADEVFLTRITEGAAQADLAVSINASPSPAAIQHNLTYTISVANAGPESCNAVTLFDQLSASRLFFVSAAASQGDCQVAGSGLVTCSLGTVAAKATATVTVVVRPTLLGTMSNSATVNGFTPETTLGNNRATVATIVTPASPGRGRAVRK